MLTKNKTTVSDYHPYLQYINSIWAKKITYLFISIFYLRYVEMNVKYSQGYRKYSSEIPHFLVNRPRILVTHCIERIFAAKEIESHHIECTDSMKGKFKIRSQSQDGCWYLLSFGDSQTMCRCECQDWQKWWLPCKHFIAIFNLYPAWQWESLSPLNIHVFR